ncbi:hypothetical protein PHYSODRAFT_307538 [Phytophthora sojae]|uniref:Uncharacterized protein n=1 Tax=Phytophthora sojae (strain P6497) TaxID=1094619 RepID=G5AF04_PHYSP|nr:hypothetical protein PHYSODRAFT_307538 [Phytophthora sojae]EGZ05794.1 hypothetical protein PHYSODRAFT_307538 [Phytophthora sojae]|eukprot:XP_009538655.1 hypothetical protein PHYSODRAFT_307538 [Phytophthora sojae]
MPSSFSSNPESSPVRPISSSSPKPRKPEINLSYFVTFITFSNNLPATTSKTRAWGVLVRFSTNHITATSHNNSNHFNVAVVLVPPRIDDIGHVRQRLASGSLALLGLAGRSKQGKQQNKPSKQDELETSFQR